MISQFKFFLNLCFVSSKTITFCEIGCEIFQMILPHSFSFFSKIKKDVRIPAKTHAGHIMRTSFSEQKYLFVPFTKSDSRFKLLSDYEFNSK